MIDTVLFDIGGTLITQTHSPERAVRNAQFFRTVLHETAKEHDAICFSGGRIGLQVETSAENLAKLRLGWQGMSAKASLRK